MIHRNKSILIFMICLFLSANLFSVAQAAGQASLQIKSELDSSNFWDYSFVKESTFYKPASVKLEWSLGYADNKPKTEILIPAGKKTGQFTIVSERGETVNLLITVRGFKNEVLGSWNFQIINKGQTEMVYINVPENVSPEFTRGTDN